MKRREIAHWKSRERREQEKIYLHDLPQDLLWYTHPNTKPVVIFFYENFFFRPTTNCSYKKQPGWLPHRWNPPRRRHRKRSQRMQEMPTKRSYRRTQDSKKRHWRNWIWIITLGSAYFALPACSASRVKFNGDNFLLHYGWVDFYSSLANEHTYTHTLYLLSILPHLKERIEQYVLKHPIFPP